MKIIHILPSKNVVSGIKFNPGMQMILTHLVERDPHYADMFRFYENSSGYKILDNSLIELGEAVHLKRVLTAAERVGAHEIILPDVFLNGPKTLRLVGLCIEYLRRHDLLDKYKLMAVCQGKDADEFADTFNKLNAIPEIDVIGIPKVCAKLHPAGRPYFEPLWWHCDKEIHLLGVWYGWEELTRYNRPDKIRSVDSCLAAFQTYYNLPVTAVRPDGHTIDLETCDLSESRLGATIRRVVDGYCTFRCS